MTWKDIEENLRHITTDIGCCSGDLCPGDHDGRILGFFKSQFKQAMEEIVGEKEAKVYSSQFFGTYLISLQSERNEVRQEILDKLTKFFE